MRGRGPRAGRLTRRSQQCEPGRPAGPGRLSRSREPHPSGEASRLQPLWGALIVTALSWAGLRVLERVLLPGPWQSRAFLITAAVLLITGGARVLWPRRPVLPCVLGLLAGSTLLAAQSLASPALSTWMADPASALAEVGQQVRSTHPPMSVSDSLSLLLAALALLIAWWCALISTTGGDRVGVTAVVPASSMLVAGSVADWTPPGRVVAGFGMGILLLIASAAPMAPARRGSAAGAAGLAGLRARLGLAGARVVVLVLALVLAAGVGGGLPVRAQDDLLDRVVGREKSVPETSLTLGSDLVHSTGTAFSYQAEGSEGGESLRFTLAVVRDLDGGTWDPISVPDNARTVSEPPTGLDGAALTPVSVLEASGGQAAGSGVDVPGLRGVVIRVDDLVTDRLPALQSTLVVDAVGERVTSAWGGTALDTASWRWIPGTSTARSWRDTTATGDMYRAYGWSAVAGLDGWPMIAPPYPAPAPAAEDLAPYLALPVGQGDSGGGSGVVHSAGAEALAAAGLGPSSPVPARAAALAAWFHGNGFVYNESAPGDFDGTGAGGGSADPVSTVEAFLAERSGYCVHYAAAFTLMARDMGLPTRIAIGYASHSPTLGQGAGPTQVRAEDLHAWPEVWIDGAGWVAFEPTPGGAGARANRDTPAEADPAPTATASPKTTASAPATASQVGAEPTEGGAAPSAGGWADPVEGAGGARVGAEPSGLAVGAVVLLMLSLLAGPAVIRVMRRRRRAAVMCDGNGSGNGDGGFRGVRGRGGGGGPAEAAWGELLDSAADLGLISRGTALPSRTPGAVVARLTEALGAGDGSARESLSVLESAVVRERYGAGADEGAGSAAGEPGLDEALGICVREMREHASWPRRVRARLLPTSLLRPFRI
ncbi:transglutaminase-like domain-containing protein [Actinomyces timonensis]|uniref:Transglutaminase-like domain-containing protein n=1 Tax=Actinomyces timonensis TaxID=1288391 RepID=A0AAU8N2L5_9ACTO